MKQQIQQLVGSGNLKAAIQVLMDNNVEGAIALSGRFTRLTNDILIGVISSADANIERNRITVAILHLAGLESSTAPTQQVANSNVDAEQALKRVIAINQRRNKTIATEAQELLNAVRDYKDSLDTKPSYDLTGRTKRTLEAKVKTFLEKVNEAADDSVEAFGDKVKQLIIDDAPSYDNLQEAFVLCVGRGFKNTGVEATLHVKPDDENARILVAEKLELFLLSLAK